MISIKCGLNTFLKWKGNPKIWVVGLFLIFYVYNLTAPIVKFCKEVNYAVSPWLFPYFFSNPTTLLLFMLAFVLYLCDAPFLDQQQVFVLLQDGTTKVDSRPASVCCGCFFRFFSGHFFPITYIYLAASSIYERLGKNYWHPHSNKCGTKLWNNDSFIQPHEQLCAHYCHAAILYPNVWHWYIAGEFHVLC